jgi:putative ABC transport system permease protein
MDQFLKDFLFGVRTLRRSPGFTFTALTTLALGIGASTAIFSVVNAVLLRPLPYAKPSELVLVTADLTKRSVRDFPVSSGDLNDIRTDSKQLAGLTGLFAFRMSVVAQDGSPEPVPTAVVTAGFFPLLGRPIAAGRDFQASDHEFIAPPPQPPAGQAAPANPPPPPVAYAILSHEYWQRRYNGDRSVLNSTIRNTGGGTFQVVGIAPPGTELLFPQQFGVERRPDIFIAARTDWSTPRQNVQWRVIGRLRPGASVEEARNEIGAFNTRFHQEFPTRATSGHALRLEPLHDNLVDDVKPAVLALMGGVTFVLLIACANVANLLLVRTARRERELAVRAALGGSRARLVRQMLAEAAVLALGGAALGLLLARLGIALLLAMGPANLPRITDVSLDPFVLGFTALASMAAVALFGVVPALRASRPDMMSTLRSSGRIGSLGTGRALRNGVVVAEVALAFVLLVGSGLMFRSFIEVSRVDPGFDPEGVLTFNAQPTGRPPEQMRAYIRSMQDQLKALNGVTAVTAARGFPLDIDVQRNAGARWGTEAAVGDPSRYLQGDFFVVQPGYFDAMKIRLIDGRAFAETDNVPESKSIVIDRMLAAKAFPGESAVGKRLSVRFRTNEAELVDVIGVVEHTRNTSLSNAGRETFYATEGQTFTGAATRWAVRTTGNPAQLEPQVRATIKAIDPMVLVTDVRPMSKALDESRAPTKFALVLVGIFAGIAGVLSAVGLYGVLASAVRERTAEIGVRMALGAATAGIFGLVIRQGLKLSAIGLGLGLVAAFALTRTMQSLLVGVSPTDPLTFAAIGVFFFSVAVLACWVPARRASRVDPLEAMRGE